MSETEAYDRVLSCVMNHPLNREALIEILRYCEQERDQADVEAHMQAPSAAYSALLSPYRLICQLVDAGGIVCTEVDADGEPVTDDRKAGLSEDELDDLVQGWRYETTDAGNEVAGYFDPARRVERLAAAHPEAVAAFRTVLLFCDRPRANVRSWLRSLKRRSCFPHCGLCFPQVRRFVRACSWTSWNLQGCSPGMTVGR